MPRQDGRIEQGQSLKTAISARAWNRAQDAADIVLGQRYGTEAVAATSTRAPFTALPCRNISGQDVPLWGVLRISGLEVTPTSAEIDAATKSFQTLPLLQGTTPTASTSDAFVIAVEPIRNGSIGQVAIDGVVQAKLDVRSESHLTAGPKNNSRTQLQTGKGNAEILWKSGAGTIRWALVRIGGRATMKVGTISSTWNKGTSKTVTEINSDRSPSDGLPTFTAWNFFSDVYVTAVAKTVACHLIDGTWVLVAAEC